ncbi:MAG TPA: ROK family protein [Solirubrobacterales bacterium]|nr:ROK family protein [Solirubrobacterales bacterium]
MSPVETIGVDLGGSNLRVAVVDGDRNVLYRSTESSSGDSAEEVLSNLGDELAEARAARPSVVAAGLGIPCTIDQQAGVAIAAVNLPLIDVPIRELMRERLGLPVFIDNDVNAAILAEHRFGAARGVRNAVMLTLGTGIGGALLLGGTVYRGTRGAGSELGHMVVDLDGPRCQGNCPNRGCIEALASGTALAREGREAAEREPGSRLGRALAGAGEVTGETVTEAALAGDATAGEVVALVGRRLGAALSSLANIFEPEVIVVGGGVMAAGELLLEPARRELRARALPPMNAAPVAVAELGDDAGLIGAATMARLELGEAV